jgi:hypothetical protein
MKKLTLLEIQNRILKHSNTKILSKEYFKNTQLLDLQCECGVLFQRSYANIQKHNNYKCNDCEHINIVTWDKINKYILENSDSKLLHQKYINEDQLLKIKCSCGNNFERKWSVLRQGIGFICEECSGIINWNYNMVKNWVEENTTAQFLSYLYINANTKYNFLCECGNTYSCTWNKFYYGKQQKCQKCTSSRGENLIRFYLDKNNITYNYEKKFDNLRGFGNRKLSYDFAINNSNYLIEYQGEFHDGTAKIQTKEAYVIQKLHDKIKLDYAKDTGYKLIVIWYYEINNIDNILDEALFEYKNSISA